MPDLPSGTVTFLFTDIEGSTKLLHELGADGYAEALAEHRRVLRAAFAAHEGVEVDTQGDAFFVAFPTAPGALQAAAEGAERLTAGPIRVRIGIHTGTPLLSEGYVGVDVHRAARIAACGHGGQVLVSASTAALTGTGELRDLGKHRLKDLSAPERLYQLGDGDFPPLKSLYRTNLPVPATPFLGREHELAEVLGLLESAPLLTLTGPGGTGKTRLGLQAAAEASDRYPDGVFWVALAALREPDLVLESAGQALGAKDGLAQHIADKSLLLLLDNFEHVVEAAAGLAELLAACPNLQLLVTSRELLRLPAEQAYPVPPLEPEDGTELFLARARAVEPGFAASAAVPELCARLEQLPLALELAAPRVRILSTEQLLERLSGRLDLLKAGRGVDARQQTLRATIEWSHDLLSHEEQSLFRRLSVFAGGCTLEAAEEIAKADLDTLQSLVDKSLLRYSEERFWMLETIREYAAERLEASGEAKELRRRHADYFLALADEAEPHLRQYEPDWLDRLDAEHDNFRAALDRLHAEGEAQLVLRLVSSLSWVWSWRNEYLGEGRWRLRAALASDESPSDARAKALTAAAELAYNATDPEEARLRAEEGLSIHRSLGNAWHSAYTLNLLGLALMQAGDQARVQGLARESERLLREAARRQEEAVQLLGELGDEYHRLDALFNLAYSYYLLGREHDALAMYEEMLEEARRIGHEHIEAFCLGALANVRGLFEDRPGYAIPLLKEAITITQRLGDRLVTGVNISRLANAAALAGEPRVATVLLGASKAIYDALGAKPRPWAAEQDEKTLVLIRARLDETSFAEAWERGTSLDFDEAVAVALDYEGP
jgi:predicted ATPase/class 3 adenylate cyclase